MTAELETLRAKLKTYEDLGGAADDVQLLRMGYAAARLEIESLRGRSVEPAVKYPPLPEPLAIDWPELHSHALGCGVEDRGLHNRYECAEYGWQDGVDKCAERVPDQIFDADQMRAYVDADRAMRAAQPAGAPQPGAAYAALPDGELLPCPCCGGEAQEYDRFNANRVSCKSCGLYLRQSEQGSGDAAARWNRRASHGQAPAQAAPDVSGYVSEWAGGICTADEAMTGIAKLYGAQASPAYKDSTPDLHVGDSSFESWYADYVKEGTKGLKQHCRDAYAAGMGDPLVMAAPAAVAGPINRIPLVDRNDPTAELLRDKHNWWELYRNGDPVRSLSRFECEFVNAALAAAPTTQPAPQQEAPADELEEVLRERDDAEDFINELLDEVLGADRPEWSSAYNRYDAMNDVRERITALHKPAVDKAWGRFESAMAAPQPSPAAQGDALDTIRLDWLDADESRCVFHLGKSWYTRPSYGMPYRKRASLREAIDAARAAQEGRSCPKE